MTARDYAGRWRGGSIPGYFTATAAGAALVWLFDEHKRRRRNPRYGRNPTSFTGD